MANQAESPDRSVQQGSLEPVPTRQTGKENKGLLAPTQDDMTEQRRNKFGETGKEKLFGNKGAEFPVVHVNDIDTYINPTRNDRIRGSNSDQNPETGFGRHSCQ